MIHRTKIKSSVFLSTSYVKLNVMKKHSVIFSVLFFISFTFGFYCFYTVVGKNLDENEREVASIQQLKINNLKIFESESLQKELSKKIKIYSVSNEKVIALEGFSSQLCKTFSSVELFFDAYGVSVSGETPQFKVTAECLPGQDPAEIAVIKIPIEKLLNEKARSAEFKYSEYKESFELINSDEWAKTWLLTKIVFKSSSESKVIKVSNDKPISDQPIVLEF